jgi:hypothetical protein
MAEGMAEGIPGVASFRDPGWNGSAEGLQRFMSWLQVTKLDQEMASTTTKLE